MQLLGDITETPSSVLFPPQAPTKAIENEEPIVAPPIKSGSNNSLKNIVKPEQSFPKKVEVVQSAPATKQSISTTSAVKPVISQPSEDSEVRREHELRSELAAAKLLASTLEAKFNAELTSQLDTISKLRNTMQEIQNHKEKLEGVVKQKDTEIEQLSANIKQQQENYQKLMEKNLEATKALKKFEGTNLMIKNSNIVIDEIIKLSKIGEGSTSIIFKCFWHGTGGGIEVAIKETKVSEAVLLHEMNILRFVLRGIYIVNLTNGN